MKITSDIEYSFTVNSNTYHIGDYVKVKTYFLERYGEITKINDKSFKIKVDDNDERVIVIKYDSLKDIEKDLTWSEKYLIKLNKDKQVLTKLNEFIEDNNISCKEDISQIDSINEQCVDLVAELVEIIKGA